MEELGYTQNTPSRISFVGYTLPMIENLIPRIKTGPFWECVPMIAGGHLRGRFFLKDGVQSK